jgi:hypothetical protein
MGQIPTQKTSKAGTSLFVQIAIVLLGVVGGYMYYSSIIKPAKITLSVPEIPKEDSLNKFKDTKSFDFSVLNDPVFKSLKILGDVPVKPGTTGRTDLFAPF